MASQSFAAAVDGWVRKSKRRTRAIFQTAVQEVAREANTTIPDGGRLPKDTGFLQNSFSGSLEGPPRGPSDQATDSPGDFGAVVLIIAEAEIGDSIYLGWSANYARAQEARNGFRDAAAQNWPNYVRKATAEAKAKIP